MDALRYDCESKAADSGLSVQRDVATTPAGTAANDRSGEVLNGRLRLRSLIDRSHQLCDLYVAEDLRSRSLCTVKMPRRQADPKLDVRSRFLREAQVMPMLCHPNIAQITEVNCDEYGNPYAVLEGLQGQTLQQLLNKEGRLSLQRTLEIIRPLAAALQYVHDIGVVHGGIKAASVFLHRLAAGKETVVKLMDFELARNLNASQPSGLLNVQSLFIGVPVYLPPEGTHADRGAIDAKSDQYALAALTFRLLSGHFPIENEDPLLTCALIRERAPQRLDQLEPSLPAHVAEAVHIALSKSKDQRHESVRDFIRWLEGRPPLGQISPAQREVTVHGFRPDLIALCRRDSQPPEASASAPLQSEGTTEIERQPLVDPAPECTQQELVPYGAEVGRAYRRQVRWAFAAALCLGLGLGTLSWKLRGPAPKLSARAAVASEAAPAVLPVSAAPVPSPAAPRVSTPRPADVMRLLPPLRALDEPNLDVQPTAAPGSDIVGDGSLPPIAGIGSRATPSPALTSPPAEPTSKRVLTAQIAAVTLTRLPPPPMARPDQDEDDQTQDEDDEPATPPITHIQLVD